MGKHKKLTARAEEYLETILNMTMEGRKVVAARLAERLMVSPPTVTGALRRLKRDGLVSAKMGKEILLTPRGEKEARNIVRRHRLVERLLTDVLDIDWSECHEEACKIEHAISPLVEDRLYERLGHPVTCPHGNPIPTDRAMHPPPGTPLDGAAQGTQVEVMRIGEEATRNKELMRFFQNHGIFPGRTFRVKEVAEYAGTVTLAGNSETVTLGIKVAEAIWVTPVSEHT